MARAIATLTTSFIRRLSIISLFLILLAYRYLDIKIKKKPDGNKQTFTRNPYASWKPFNETNPHLKSFCPAAICNNSPMCAPCNRRFLFILATPRSGSTTILQTLNNLPGVRLSGENDHAFHKLWALIHGKRMDKILKQDYDRPTGAWMHNAIPRGVRACTAQQFMQTLNPPPLAVQKNANILPLSTYDRSTIFGAKMIRIQNEKWNSKAAANFISENFPCSKVVVNIRSDVDSQLASVGNTFVNHNHKNTTYKYLRENEFLISLADELGDSQARVIDMTKWSEDVGIINNLIEWVGFKGCALEEMLHTNHGEDGFQQDDIEGDIFGRTCQFMKNN